MVSIGLIAAALQLAQPQLAAAQHWRVAPVEAGNWSWRAVPGGSEAAFANAAGVQFMLRCNLASRTVTLLRSGAPVGTPVVVRTTSLERTLPATGMLGAQDRLLDAIAFSRGRFSVEVAGVPRLIVPSWPEPARAIEDCRK
ncbi:hypothetical protein OMW55_03745 [Sphingomonas sp. BN140010]|uniref:Uncharacterized protein n=1 Tax=Sphingomonas arvum TaxID=2992113 RepID=A0ABT3JCX7_9SPHN|nr:hypothetical protein [Sphingomonas sp. BN140010]MCW3796917.1 hypothetical protein [Sphingomonas sp. BN140010]